MATISDFRAALASPASYFKRLTDIAWPEGVIIRSTYFAEAVIERSGRPCLLCMPLHPDALRRAERFVVRKRYITSPVVPRIEILRDEMRCGNAACDILLEPLPRGVTLAEAISDAADATEAAALAAALDAMQAALEKAGVSLFNLREENIVVEASGAMHPVRWYYAAEGCGSDVQALDRLRARIAGLFPDEQPVQHTAAERTAASCDGHLEMNPMFEGLSAVLDSTGWGFVDCDNHPVIRPRFKWVDNFREGRAMVMTRNGMMGLIDRQGRYIIRPRYKIVEYDPRSGNSYVRRGNKWGVFDYSGHLIEDFSNIKPAI